MLACEWGHLETLQGQRIQQGEKHRQRIHLTELQQIHKILQDLEIEYADDDEQECFRPNTKQVVHF